MDLLNGKMARGEDKGDGDQIRPQPMDILLDTCWALMAEIQQMDDPPPALHAFKSKCKVQCYCFENSIVSLIDERMFGRIASVRNCNDSYDIVEKIGTGAYGNVLRALLLDLLIHVIIIIIIIRCSW